MITLGQKLKMQKNMLKTFLQGIAVVLCKKRLQKTANIRKMRPFLKLAKMATKQRLEPFQNGHFGSKIQNAKKHAKTFLQDIALILFLCKKTARKNN